MDKITKMLQHADLEILEYSIDERTDMQNNDRLLPFSVMSYLQAGTATLRVGDTEYPMKEGTVILIPPNVRHDHFKCSTDRTVFLWWHFHFKVASVVDVVNLLGVPIASQLRQRERFEAVFNRFYRLSVLQNRNLEQLLLLRAHSLELMAILLGELISDGQISAAVQVPEVFTQILYDVTDLEKKDVTLGSLAEKYHLNPSYLSTQFKRHFGCSPIAMRRNIVVGRAKVMLRNSGMSIGEVGEAVGFDNLYQFTRFFTSREGMSPTAYRNGPEEKPPAAAE